MADFQEHKEIAMARSEATMKEPPVPREVEFSTAGDCVLVRARAGSFGWQPMLGLVLCASLATGSGIALLRVGIAVRDGIALNPGPAIFLCTLGVLLGTYVAALCLWTMMGHETLLIRNGRLSLSNPWLFGLRTRRFDVSRITPFRCARAGCDTGAQASGCCCSRWAVDYVLLFGDGPKEVGAFSQLSVEAKDWLRDRLNELLRTGASVRV